MGNDYLNGTWGRTLGEEIKFDNGYFEFLFYRKEVMKGTYLINCEDIILKITHIHGSLYSNLKLSILSQWYTKDEFKNILGSSSSMSINEISKIINDAFIGQTGTFNKDINTLSITILGQTYTFKKIKY